MHRQMQWSGNSLIDTGLLVCEECLDIPFEQYRTPLLPPDPTPRINPRPSPNVTPLYYPGAPQLIYLRDENGKLILNNLGQPIITGDIVVPAVPTTPENQGFSQYVLPPSFPIDRFSTHVQDDILLEVSKISGVTTPAFLSFTPVIMAGNQTVPLLQANSTRYWLLVYNPTQFVMQISTGVAIQGAITNLSIGPHECYFWATAQGLEPVYQGAMTAIGLYSFLPLWVWEGATTPTTNYLRDDHGNLILDQNGHPIPVVLA